MNTASANYFYGEEVDTFCAGKPGFDNPPVFGGEGSPLDETNCSKCHSPSGPNNGQTQAFNIYKNNNKNPNQALCDLVAPPPPAPTCTDVDNDSYSIEGGACGAIDCDDNNPLTYPGATELCTDSVDNNCNMLVDNLDPKAVDCPTACSDADNDNFSPDGGICAIIVNIIVANFCSTRINTCICIVTINHSTNSTIRRKIIIVSIRTSCRTVHCFRVKIIN